jgi:hypothetical protein
MTARPEDAERTDEAAPAAESTTPVDGESADTTLGESSFPAEADLNATIDVHSTLADAAAVDDQPTVDFVSKAAEANDTAALLDANQASAAGTSAADADDILATVQAAWPDMSDKGTLEETIVAGEDSSPLLEITINSEGGGETTLDEFPVTDEPLHVSERMVVERGIEFRRALIEDHAEYELGLKLGSGGIGVVYEARQTSINRSVAVKMLQEQEADATQSRKFLEEAVITGELDHPNIVPVYDLGRTKDGQLFYAMKQVRGTPWRDVLHTQTMEERLRILLRSSDAVAFAHSRGVVHRDLKPENIMLGEFGEVLVMDWGLALHRDRHNESNSSLGGTPGFMAPEMVLGPISAIGPHSDIYLLGAILFQVINGYPPHSGKDQMDCLLNAARNKIEPAEESGELLDIALKALAKSATDRFSTVLEFQAAIREYLSHDESLALESDAQEAAERARQTGDYNTFSEAVYGFENAIRLWDGNDGAHAGLTATRGEYARAACEKGDFDLGLSVLQPEGAEFDGLREELRSKLAEREARTASLRRAQVIGLGLVASLLIVSSVAAVWINSERNAAEKNHQQADQNFKLAKQAVDEMLTKSAAALEDEPGQHELRQSLLGNAQDFYERLVQDRPDDPDLQYEMGLAWHRLGEINNDLGEFDAATEAFSNAIEIQSELSGLNPGNPRMRRQLAETHDSLGENYRTLQKNLEAESQYNLALALLNDLTQKDDQNRIYHVQQGRSLNNLGLVYYQTNRGDEAHAAFSQVITDLTKLPLKDDTRLQLARASLNRGRINTSKTESADARLQDARADYERAISLLVELRATSPRKASYRLDLCKAHVGLGNLLVRDRDNRDLRKAEHHIQISVGLADELVTDFIQVNEYRRERDNTLNSLAAVYYYDKKYAEAAKAWDRVREEAQRLFDQQPEVPANRSQLGRALSNLGVAHNKLESYEEARQVLVEARDHLRTATQANAENPEFKRYLRNALRSLSDAHLGLGDHKAARQATLEVVELYPEASSELYVQSRKMALCVSALASDDSLTDPQRAELRSNYVTTAVQLLEKSSQRAVEEGSPNYRQSIIEAQSEFDAIRKDPMFQELFEKFDGD